MDARNPFTSHLPDEEALYSLMTMYYEELFRYGVKFTADAEETKDALNQFFIHFWDNRSKLDKVENLKGYLFVSYKRWLIAAMRRATKYRSISLEDTDEPAEQSYEEFLVTQIRDQERGNILKEAIGSLPPRQRQLLQLRFYEHLEIDEIAIRTSLSIRTIYNKLHEAIKKLRTFQSIKKLR
jgi:RNA polymerase sigma-70 factor (ECF subfamily)